MISLHNDFNKYIIFDSTSEDSKLKEYENKRPAYFKNKAQARAYELGKVLIQKHKNWAGKITLDSAECACILMFDVSEEIEIKANVKNPYDAVIKAMKCVSIFFNEGEIEVRKYGKGSQGMRYLCYFPKN